MVGAAEADTIIVYTTIRQRNTFTLVIGSTDRMKQQSLYTAGKGRVTDSLFVLGSKRQVNNAHLCKLITAVVGVPLGAH